MIFYSKLATLFCQDSLTLGAPNSKDGCAVQIVNTETVFKLK